MSRHPLLTKIKFQFIHLWRKSKQTGYLLFIRSEEQAELNWGSMIEANWVCKSLLIIVYFKIRLYDQYLFLFQSDIYGDIVLLFEPKGPQQELLYHKDLQLKIWCSRRRRNGLLKPVCVSCWCRSAEILQNKKWRENRRVIRILIEDIITARCPGIQSLTNPFRRSWSRFSSMSLVISSVLIFYWIFVNQFVKLYLLH